MIEPDFEMYIILPPQITQEEAIALEELNDQVDGPMQYLTQLQLFGNLLMAYGLKYLWNTVNLFQFLFYFGNWKIAIAP